MGIILLRRGNLREAPGWFEKAVELSPFDPVTTGNLGLVRWSQGRKEESCELLNRAVERGFSAPSARYILGLAALKKGLSRDAVRQLSAIPEEGFPYRSLFLSVALRDAGERRKADKELHSFFRARPAELLPSHTGTVIW
jgi:tetratricopeptide (TPR) repeat protein